MGTESSGLCLLAEVDIDHMLLLLQTVKIVQLQALLVQTNSSWSHGSSKNPCLFCCLKCCCVLLLLYIAFGEWVKPLAQRPIFGVEERATNTFAEEVHQRLYGDWEPADRGARSWVGSDVARLCRNIGSALDYCYQTKQCKTSGINKVNKWKKQCNQSCFNKLLFLIIVLSTAFLDFILEE